MSYDEFKKYHDENPDMDNSEYYEKFPDVNQSTIRSWKSKIRSTDLPESPPSESPTPAQAQQHEGFEEQQKHYIQLLMKQTGSNPKDFEGLDANNTILVLKNKLKAQESEKPKARGLNSSILPSPAPMGANKKKFGIDEYIVFDGNLNEIRMEIPLEKLMDPEENKKIRERIF